MRSVWPLPFFVDITGLKILVSFSRCVCKDKYVN